MIAWVALGCSLVALVVALWAYFEVRDLRDDAHPDSAVSAVRRSLLLAEFDVLIGKGTAVPQGLMTALGRTPE